MIQVNDPQYFLNQATEQEFQDDVNTLKWSTSSQALWRITFGEQEIPGWFKKVQKTAFVWGQQVASNTKLMIEQALKIDMDSQQDDWFKPGQMNERSEEFRPLKEQKFSFATADISPWYLQKVNKSFWRWLNIQYREVETEVALQEIGNINFPSSSDNQTYRYIHDLLFKIWNFHVDDINCRIDIARLEELTHDFHFFALQYHYDSYKEKIKDENVMFSEKLKYFLEKVKEFWVE